MNQPFNQTKLVKNIVFLNIDKRLVFSFTTIFFFLISINLIGQTTLSPEMNNMFFEKSDFKVPIYLSIPPESNLSNYQYIKDNPDIYESGIPSVRIETGKKVDDYDRSVTSFLVANGFARIETLIQTKHNSNYGDKTYTYHFIFYSEELKKRIVSDERGDKYFLIGNRKLNSIDYKNEYEDSPLGMKRKFYAIIFSYQLTNEFKSIVAVNKIFKGKAKAFQDPDDGLWKMKGSFENLGVSFDDKGKDEYLALIQNRYPPFDFNKSAVKLLEKAEMRKDSIRKVEEIQNEINRKIEVIRKDSIKKMEEKALIVKMKMEIPIKIKELDSLINSSKEFLGKLPSELITVEKANLIKKDIQGIEEGYHGLVNSTDECLKCIFDKCNALKDKILSNFHDMKLIASVIIDIDGNKYKTVQIGDQIWMAENLRTTKLNDGILIPNVIKWWNWDKLKTPAYCWYNNEEVNKEKYGALYNLYTINTNKICPTGWHVPSDYEWTSLANYLGGKMSNEKQKEDNSVTSKGPYYIEGENMVGGKLKEAGTVHWNSPNEGANNKTGFTALPGGRLSVVFESFGSDGHWWSTGKYEWEVGKVTGYGFYGPCLKYNRNEMLRYQHGTSEGISVRCIKD